MQYVSGRFPSASRVGSAGRPLQWRRRLELWFSPVVGVDADRNVAFAYEHNNAARFECSDIREIDGKAMGEWFDGAETRILGGCAPCQPFSTYTQARNKEADDRLESVLVNDVFDFVRKYRGDAVLAFGEP